MARKIALRVEMLEVRALLSNLAYSVTTDKSTYAVGQPVQLTFTETNISKQDVTVNEGPSVDGFNVSLNGTTIWQSNSGVNPQYILANTLKPGQSVTETATWNGESAADPTIAATGSFVVTNQLAPTSASANFQITSPVTYSLTTSQATYPFGNAVELMLTATNPSNQSVAVNADPASFTVTQGGNAIWAASASAGSQSFGSETLAPGQSITQSTTWDSTTSWLGQEIDHWGTFAVTSLEAPAGSTASFQIASPLTSTLTTDKSTYSTNEPVVMTFQQTNTSSQPITYLTGSDGFVVQQNGTTVYTSTAPAVTATSLQPGQSISQTATWNGIPSGGTANAPASGSFVVSTTGAPQGPTASFTISPTTTPTPTPTTTPTPSPTGTTTPAPTPTVTPTPTPTQTPTPTSTPAPTPTSTPTPAPSPTATPTPTPTATPTSTISTSQAPTSSPILATLATNRQSYRPGQSVRATLVLQNVSDSSITVSHDANSDGITVSLGARVVSRSSRTVPNAGIQQMVQPGDNMSWNASWNGRSNQRGVKHLGPGTYTIQVTEGGYSATTTFRIVG